MMDLKIIDAHFHFWEIQAQRHPWLCGAVEKDFFLGDYSGLMRDYLPADYRRDSVGLEVVKLVHCEAEWDRNDQVGETQWLTALNAASGWPTAAVGHAWLDDPALADQAFFFHNPRQFYLEYNKRFPGTWSAVSWEYVAILEIWKAAVESALTANSISVLAAMKQTGHVTHAFGPANWWGRELFGVDNALVGDWPVVQILDGKARIVEFGSVTDWLSEHGDVLKAEMERLGQMWFQR